MIDGRACWLKNLYSTLLRLHMFTDPGLGEERYQTLSLNTSLLIHASFTYVGLETAKPDRSMSFGMKDPIAVCM